MTPENQKMRDALKAAENIIVSALAHQPEDDEKCREHLQKACIEADIYLRRATVIYYDQQEDEMEEFEGKEKVYVCDHFEYADYGEHFWCRCPDSGHRECPSKLIYGMQFCPFFKRGQLRGTWVPDEEERQAGKIFLTQLPYEAKRGGKDGNE